MSLLLWNDPFDFCRPSQILNQRFGLDLEPEDFLSPLVPKEFRNFLCPAGYIRPWRSLASQDDVGSTVSFEKDKFQANLDVQQFKPEEISVKVTGDNTITIEGKHEEKEDDKGYISRQFKRTYVLPRGHDCSKVESKLSSDGVLTITAPRVECDSDAKCIPITQTGKPSKQIEDKKSKGSCSPL